MGIAEIWNSKQWTRRITENAEWIAEHRWSLAIVAAIEFVGCTLIPLPVALIIFTLVAAAPLKWKRFAFSATAGSVVAGLMLYFVGRLFFGSFGIRLIHFYGIEAKWATIVDKFNGGFGISLIALAAATTGLFRVSTLGAGFTGMNPVVFLSALAVTQAARWTIECGAVRYFGDHIKKLPAHYVKYAAAGAVLLLAVAVLIFRLYY
jgi:membrane protein YqaA with SNARE-associated domain